MSLHYSVVGNAKNPYKVTINFKTGHWCTCRGMLSKKKTFGEDAGRTKGTCCKHVLQIVNDHCNGDWGIKVSGGKGARTRSSTPVDAQTSGRRAAVMATREKLKQQPALKAATSSLSLNERISALEATR